MKEHIVDYDVVFQGFEEPGEAILRLPDGREINVCMVETEIYETLAEVAFFSGVSNQDLKRNPERYIVDVEDGDEIVFIIEGDHQGRFKVVGDTLYQIDVAKFLPRREERDLPGE